jgi:hypothetical protein
VAVRTCLRQVFSGVLWRNEERVFMTDDDPGRPRYTEEEFDRHVRGLSVHDWNRLDAIASRLVLPF